MGAAWFEPLRPLCDDACALVAEAAPADVVLFYVARWCQKQTGDDEPDVTVLDLTDLADAAAKVVDNLARDGAGVDRLVAGDAEAWSALRRSLRASAGPRVGALAAEFADEALQKIAVVLLTGTPPSQAVTHLAGAVEGPGNEYVFTAPFAHWARTVLVNLIVDEKRRAARERRAPRTAGAHASPCLDATTLARAHAALPGLLEAVAGLPPVQRSVMVWSLMRGDLEASVRARLRELAPDLFDGVCGPSGAGDGRGTSGDAGGDAGGLVSSDQDIADRLRTTARLVAANRSVARCRLAARDPLWALLFDVLLPHRSTRSPGKEAPDG